MTIAIGPREARRVRDGTRGWLEAATRLYCVRRNRWPRDERTRPTPWLALASTGDHADVAFTIMMLAPSVFARLRTTGTVTGQRAWLRLFDAGVWVGKPTGASSTHRIRLCRDC